MLLTLISNHKKVYINPDNIAFAVTETAENPETKEMESFTRICLKQLAAVEGMLPWVDVQETLNDIWIETR